MSEPTIFDFYSGLIQTAGLEIDDDFFVVHKAESDKKKPENVMVMNKKLVLPFPGHLKNPDPDNNVFFHPLCEQITRGESEVFAFLKRAVTMRLIMSVTALGAGLIRLHTDINQQKNMSIQQIEFIKGLVDAEDKTIGLWTTFIWGNIKANPHDSTHWPLRLYLKQNGRFDNKSYQRVCSVAFPLFERLLTGEEMHKPGTDQKYPAKVYKAFRQIATAIFPEIEAEFSEAYNSGYADTFAPNLLAFLMSVKKIADRLNTIAETLRDPLEKAGVEMSAVTVSTPWEEFLTPEGIEKLSAFNRRIPGLPGNMGTVSAAKQEPVEEACEVPSTRSMNRPAPVNDSREKLRARWDSEAITAEDPPWEDKRSKEPSAQAAPTRSIGDILRKRPELERSTRTYEEEMDRGRYGRGRYDSRYDEPAPRRGGRSMYDDPPRRGGWREEPEPRDYGRGRYDSRYDDRGPRRGLYDDIPDRRGGWRR